MKELFEKKLSDLLPKSNQKQEASGYGTIVDSYKRRQRDTLVDAICAGLTYADNIAVETGLLAETGLLSELTESACGALPFVIIAATEGSKVVLGRKNGASGVKDCAWRMAKTGIAMGVGGLACAAGGLLLAVPATIGTRAVLDKVRTQAMTNVRVQGRITRLQELNSLLRREKPVCEAEAAPESATPVEGGTIQ